LDTFVREVFLFQGTHAFASLRCGNGKSIIEGQDLDGKMIRSKTVLCQNQFSGLIVDNHFIFYLCFCN
jgi:hypothetical protein